MTPRVRGTFVLDALGSKVGKRRESGWRCKGESNEWGCSEWARVARGGGRAREREAAARSKGRGERRIAVACQVGAEGEERARFERAKMQDDA